MTATTTLTTEQQDALDRVHDAARNLHRFLRSVRADVNHAIENLEAGLQVSGMGLGFGPIGHQAPFDVAQATHTLEFALRDCNRLRCPADAINAAYIVDPKAF